MEQEKVIWLNGNQKQTSYLAIGSETELEVWEEKGAFEKATKFLDANEQEYVFGWFGYDLKNDIENLYSENPSWVNVPLIFLMKPMHLARIKGSELNVLKGDEATIRQTLNRLLEKSPTIPNSINLHSTLTEADYLKKIRTIKEHIHRGDIYEANFCYEFKGEGEIDPKEVYHRMNELTKAPFSVYADIGSLSVLSASPERFVKKKGSRVFTQPIKGTLKRGSSEEEDKQLIEQLRNSRKDRSENIMIVDLVRNDLSRIAEPRSVQVEELCEVYTFENIHQMISTVSAEVKHKHPIEIMKALFPMGSMTGAPKIRAMEIIEELEESRRGLYSGCIGYFTPNGDFDFNVVIRTILYDKKAKRLSFSVGGAITDLSEPEEEYEETLLKAKALIEALKA
ncbi:aminodeoxychorismate synthase component I [Parvicella tangerina]|uniref:Isochorismate synthase MenF n=1 Tax=Parvicella tangerina TaxID=2829795 RepID=A0A916JJX9_9FLAO|nr:aminodeoxychorismate synthase component I [Parvicella tangerina]CAG5076821.1 Isochorismate synthase MenF [Parvicella tangerina]